MAITRLDILDGIRQLRICTGYKYQGEIIKEFPASLKVLGQVEPLYEDLPGWEETISGITSYDALPVNCRRYVERLSEVTGIPIGIVSVGPRRDQTIILHDMF